MRLSQFPCLSVLPLPSISGLKAAGVQWPDFYIVQVTPNHCKAVQEYQPFTICFFFIVFAFKPNSILAG